MTGWFGLSGRKFLLAQIPDRADEEKTTTGILIPEVTASVCRFMAKQSIDDPNLTAKMPMKLFYTTTCFRNELEEELTDTKLRAFGQIGFEFLGAKAPNPDVETILLAKDCLEAIGVPARNIRVRLGDVRIFRKLTERMDPKRRYELQQVFDELAREKAIGQSASVKQLIEQISSELSWGGKCKREARLLKQTLSKMQPTAREMFGMGITQDMNEPEPKAVWCDIEGWWGLETRFGGLGRQGYENWKKLETAIKSAVQDEKRISVVFDPAVVRGWAYYTGPVFQIDVVDKDKVYLEVAGGGRYDTLIGAFAERYGLNVNMPATGFAFGTERLEELFKRYSKKNLGYEALTCR